MSAGAIFDMYISALYDEYHRMIELCIHLELAF